MRGCTTSGFGPVENSGDGAGVTCVIGDVRTTAFSALSVFHGPCDGVGERIGPNCNAAIHRYCASLGATTGFGPIENSGDTAVVTCVPHAVVVTTSYSELVTHHGGCDGASERIGVDCNAAIHRFCGSRGYTSGWGPVENSGDVAIVSCVGP